MPAFYSKSRKTWYLRVTVGGKQFYCYKPAGPSASAFTRKKDAQQYEPVFIATLTDEGDQSSITCDDLAPLFLKDRQTKLKPNSYYGVQSVFRLYVLPFFHNMKACDVSNAYLDTINAQINAKKKSNLYQQACCFRSWIRFLKKSKPDLDPSRISAPKSYKPDDRNYQIYTPEQFEKLLSVIDKEEDRFMMTLFFYYGLRCGELMGLKWSDFSGGKLRIRRSVSRRGYSGAGQEITTPKTKNSIRDYPILEVIKPFLQSVPKISEYCFPCCNKTCDAVTIGHSEVRRRVDKYIKLAGLPHMKVHGFRHSCVSYLLSQGMSYRTVARWVGDTETVVLQTYSHLLPDEKDEIATFLDKKLK